MIEDASPNHPGEDQNDVLRVIREIKEIGGKTKPMAGQIANRITWATHGSQKRLNDALQALRRANQIRYMKGIGWVEIGSCE